MGHSSGKWEPKRDDAGDRAAWGWLAAAAGGFLMGRARRRFGVAVGVGLVVWAYWKSQNSETSVHGASGALSPAEPMANQSVKAETSADAVEEGDAPAVHGGWMLNMEPMPSVVQEGDAGAEGAMGLGADWLRQGPWLTSEELDQAPSHAPQSEDVWLNGGAEIPDSVELPAVEGEKV